MKKSLEIPTVKLSTFSGDLEMPVIGLGTAARPLDETAMKATVLEAIKLGYRHFDTAALYGSEKALGEALAEAFRIGLVSSRDELFVTSKLWCSDAHAHLVSPAIKTSLRNLQLEYVDLYLIHWPLSCKPGRVGFPIPKDEILLMDFKAVWDAMEECQRLGLTKAIGVSNFSSKKLKDLLGLAKIPPLVNQVEMNPVWQQRKLREFCKGHNILVAAYSPLGGIGTVWGSNLVMENDILNQIARARGKTVAQVCLRWAYEQGVAVITRSFRKERLQENLEIFNWELSEEDYDKINQIPQRRLQPKEELVSDNGPYKSLDELWDGEL